MIEDISTSLLDITDSTTLFLESLKGSTLRVSIDAQSEQEEGDNWLVTRTSRLFFLSPHNPVLFCMSSIHKRELAPDEYRSMMETDTPIGRIFLSFNDNRVIQKQNVTIALANDRTIAARLNIKDCLVYRKEYDYVVGGRGVGRITEYFNEESLRR